MTLVHRHFIAIAPLIMVLAMKPEMCNRPRLVIDLVIDYDFFQSNRNRSFLQNSYRNRNRNPVKKNLRLRITIIEKFRTNKITVLCELFKILYKCE